MNIDNIDDKYKYDVDIISISFNYYKNNDLLKPPKLILLGKSAKFEKPQGFVGYNYFKLIFINPSNYNIHVTTDRSIYNMSNVTRVKTSLHRNYVDLLPFACSMKKTQIYHNHYKWEILLNPNTTEGGYIIIYANNLEIKDLDKLPNLDLIT